MTILVPVSRGTYPFHNAINTLNELVRFQGMLDTAKTKVCTCSGFVIQYEGSCQCGRGKAVREAEERIRLAIQALRPVCHGCGNEVDPDSCGCGSRREDHDMGSGHGFVPLGCSCGFITKEDETMNEAIPSATTDMPVWTCTVCNQPYPLVNGAPKPRCVCGSHVCDLRMPGAENPFKGLERAP